MSQDLTKKEIAAFHEMPDNSYIPCTCWCHIFNVGMIEIKHHLPHFCGNVINYL